MIQKHPRISFYICQKMHLLFSELNDSKTKCFKNYMIRNIKNTLYHEASTIFNTISSRNIFLFQYISSLQHILNINYYQYHYTIIINTCNQNITDFFFQPTIMASVPTTPPYPAYNIAQGFNQPCHPLCKLTKAITLSALSYNSKR